MTVVSMGLSLDLARWQFGITTVYHFILVPFTIGMSLLVAIMETMWYRSGREYWLKATRFFGKLFLINFALGVATGIVQEFQFGMNWSEYSRFVGDIFGAPLAFEALLSFFIESTFLGIWIFGWGRISKKAHVMVAWMIPVGVNTSMLWIIGANSWMQSPVGATYNHVTGRAELDGALAFFKVVTNGTMWLAVFHVLATSLLLAGTIVGGLAIWWMVRCAREGGIAETEARDIWQPIARWGMAVVLISGVFTIASGHLQGQHMVFYQPAKMAAAEGICSGESGDFSILAFSDCSQIKPEVRKLADGREVKTAAAGIGSIPGALGFVAHNSFSRTIAGMKESSERTAQYLEDTRRIFEENGKAVPDFTNTFNDVVLSDGTKVPYAPPMLITFWSFRLMMLFAIPCAVLAIWGLIATRQGRLSTSKALSRWALLSLPMPFLGSSFGWIFTEVGRQPFLVYPNFSLDRADGGAAVYQTTANGLSGVVSGFEVGVSMVLFTVLYAALGVVWFILMKRYAKEGVNTPAADGGPVTASQDLTFSY